MFKFKIEDTSYQLPQTPYEISYSDGERVKELERVLGKDTYNYKLSVLKMLSGCNRLNEIVEEEINAIFSGLPLFSGKSEILLSKCILMNSKKFGLIDLDKITVQEYIDIEEILSKVQDLTIASSTLSAIIYRPIKKVKHNFKTRLFNLRIKLLKERFAKPYLCNDYELEPYDLQASGGRVDDIENYLSYANALAVLYHYLDWKSAISKEYYIVFPESEKKESEDPEKEVKKKENMSTIWGMYHQLGALTENNLKEINYYKSRPIREFFYHLSYIIQSTNFSKNNK